MSEAPYPSNDEINDMGEFKISNISKSEFEQVWNSYPGKYEGMLAYIEKEVNKRL